MSSNAVVKGKPAFQRRYVPLDHLGASVRGDLRRNRCVLVAQSHDVEAEVVHGSFLLAHEA